MSFQHSNVYVVRVVDTDKDGQTSTWFVGPYGSTRADQTADQLAAARRETAEGRGDRDCYVEALFSNEDCLRVADDDRRTEGSLQ